MAGSQFDFLSQYILDLLSHLDLGDMTEEEKDQYVPKLIHQVEYRLGEALLPMVPESASGAFTTLIQREDTTAEDWAAFWKKTIPDLETRVQMVLDTFVKECETILSR